ncbi:VWA domain-containing protein [Planosporangium flavigriseum]|uniref:VWA domain-containing protein n=1 Tax=Planosporangium flavigriseum TaxID=373681 RepID=A0A8J3LJN7_9ACTN|nr:VWA domain-containing protein [Planosporangium flavigriseum]NJC65176.1 VWA domain-containing protein [Planosporangium flavigriseum]GIG71795.1 VWA domain-containing protein [Planosporangium flavigriseum]
MSTNPTGVLVGFARTLRHAGVAAATPDRVQTMVSAVDILGIEDVYWAGRLTLCGQPDDLPVYDAAFTAYFGGEKPSAKPAARPGPPRVAVPFASGPPGDDTEADDAEQIVGLSASQVEVLRHRDVAALSTTERAEVLRLIDLLAPATAPRRSRRHRPAQRGAIDAHGTVRHILRNAGEPTRLLQKQRRTKPRRLVLLLDVSGSMTPYAETLLRFGHAAVRRRPAACEVFTIGTRLTWVTRALRHRDPDSALRAAGTAIPDWHGGTRLADSLRAFLTRWGQRGTARGAVVVVCSDGWERGDPSALAEQLRRLSRLAYRLVWVNPHRGKAGYAPLAGGMAAALPYLDEFVAGHSLGALEELVGVIARA